MVWKCEQYTNLDFLFVPLSRASESFFHLARFSSSVKESKLLTFLLNTQSIYTLLVCLFVCMQLTSKRLNRSVLIFFGWTLRDQGRFMDDRICKNSLKQNLIFENFNYQQICFYNIHEIFCLFLFYNVYKEKILTIEIEDRREAT